MMVCSALFISAAIDSVSSDITSIERYFPTAICKLLGDVGDGEDFGDRLENLDLLRTKGGELARDYVECADGSPPGKEREQERGAETGAMQDVDVEEVWRVDAGIVDHERLARLHHGAEGGTLGLEDHVGPGRDRRSSWFTRAV